MADVAWLADRHMKQVQKMYNSTNGMVSSLKSLLPSFIESYVKKDDNGYISASVFFELCQDKIGLANIQFEDVIAALHSLAYRIGVRSEVLLGHVSSDVVIMGLAFEEGKGNARISVVSEAEKKQPKDK